MHLITHKADTSEWAWLESYIDVAGAVVVPPGELLPASVQGLFLEAGPAGLALRSAQALSTKPTRVDFLAKKLQYRLLTSRRNEGLPKAVGLDKSREPISVVDATAGLGSDAYILAAMGCQVLMLEKSAVMAAMLHDGLRRGLAGADPEQRQHLQRLSLLNEDTHDFLDGQLEQSEKPQVIYLDPMFPPRKKSALVKKDMALLQQLLQPNRDVAELLEKACSLAGKRVVLKRPGKQERQPDPKPDFQVPGKACHFQVFLTG